MHPILFHLPPFPAWLGAAVLAVIAAVFVVLALRDRTDTASWWTAAVFGAGAAALLGVKGFSGVVEPWPVRLFGILVVLGFLAGTKIVQARNRRLGLMDDDSSFDLCFYILLAGLAGARMLYVLQNEKKFEGEPLKMLAVWDGGLVWYGGAIAGTLYGWYRLAKQRKDVWAVSDSLALAACIGMAVGRWGCFLAGCDYGTRADPSLPWAVHFPKDLKESLVPESERVDFRGEPIWLHPAQIYESLANLLIFGILWWIDRRRTGRAFPGRLAATYLVLYAVSRGVLETWRGDFDRGSVDLGFWKPSFSQFVSLFVLAGGVLLYRALRRRRPAPAAPPA